MKHLKNKKKVTVPKIKNVDCDPIQKEVYRQCGFPQSDRCPDCHGNMHPVIGQPESMYGKRDTYQWYEYWMCNKCKAYKRWRLMEANMVNEGNNV